MFPYRTELLPLSTVIGSMPVRIGPGIPSKFYAPTSGSGVESTKLDYNCSTQFRGANHVPMVQWKGNTLRKCFMQVRVPAKDTKHYIPIVKRISRIASNDTLRV